MKLTVVGSGYVGLVTGACFAEMGNEVTCVDIDQKKIDMLVDGNIPIYEPGLDSIVKQNYKNGRIKFTTSLPEAIKGTEVILIAVGTPPGDDGSADLQYVLGVAKEIGNHINEYVVVVDKSTVPVGTADKVTDAIRSQLNTRNVKIKFDVVSNPEFLKEGAAIDDFMKPDRIVIGVNSERAKNIMRDLYSSFTRNHDRILFMGIRDAEMTKYAANAMLATKISFMNEIANLCDEYDVDVEMVRIGIGSDARIGYSFIYPGPGYGGSCFPKDVKALLNMAKVKGFNADVLESVESRNQKQKNYLFAQIMQYCGGNLAGKIIAVWGLAFKPGTDDMREAPSITLINSLLEKGAMVRVYDPVAMEAAKQEFDAHWLADGKLIFAEDQYEVLENVNALALVTEWKPFRHPDFGLMKSKMHDPVIFDGRNLYDPEHIKESGFHYKGVGR